MRRLLLMTTALLLVVSVVGCNHTHGVCDCDYHPTITTGVPAGAPSPMLRGDAVIVPQPKPIIVDQPKPMILDKEE